MKITMDKKFTEVYYMDQVKNDMKEFKARYTDGDLLRAFIDATGQWASGDIIKCDISAFTAGYLFDNVTSFCVNMIVDEYSSIVRLHFYVDMDLTVDTRGYGDGYKFYDIRRYKEV